MRRLKPRTVRKKWHRKDRLTFFDVLEIMKLRRQGWSVLKIAREYRVDHTTVVYHCKKYKVKKGKPIFFDEPAVSVPIKLPDKKEEAPQVKYNPGKVCYMDYLKTLLEREKKPMRYYMYGIPRQQINEN